MNLSDGIRLKYFTAFRSVLAMVLSYHQFRLWILCAHGMWRVMCLHLLVTCSLFVWQPDHRKCYSWIFM